MVPWHRKPPSPHNFTTSDSGVWSRWSDVRTYFTLSALKIYATILIFKQYQHSSCDSRLLTPLPAQPLRKITDASDSQYGRTAYLRSCVSEGRSPAFNTSPPDNLPRKKGLGPHQSSDEPNYSFKPGDTLIWTDDGDKKIGWTAPSTPKPTHNGQKKKT